jgi:hypothetical protein
VVIAFATAHGVRRPIAHADGVRYRSMSCRPVVVMPDVAQIFFDRVIAARIVVRDSSSRADEKRQAAGADDRFF